MIVRRFIPALPVEVAVTRATGRPARLRWRGRVERVVTVEAEWEAEYGWWQGEPEAIRRHYYRLLTGAGMLCLVYRDLGSDRWYLAGIGD